MITANADHFGPDLASIPETLQALPQWVVWRTEQRGDRTTKVPYNARSGGKAQANNDATWAPFGIAASASMRGYDGPGFMFSSDDPFVGIDLDGCRDPQTGEIAAWAERIIKSLATYGEVSPSGSGVKLFARGKLPVGSRRKWKIPGEPGAGGKAAGAELYDCDRYFAVTGWRIEGPAEPQEAQAAIEALLPSKRPTMDERRVDAQASIAPLDSSAERARKYLAKMPAAVSGQFGHDQAFAAACVPFRFGLSDTDAAAVFREYSDRCEPPWNETEQAHKLADAKADVVAAGQFGDRAKDDGRPRRKSNAAEITCDGDSPAGLPKIDISCDTLPTLTAAAWQALHRANEPPHLFRFGGIPSRLGTDDEDCPIVAPLDIDRMRFHLARCADWVRWKKAGQEMVEAPTKPPLDVVRDVLASPDIPLPPLTRITEAPVFAPDGTLHDRPGYLAASRVFYSPAPDLRFRAVAANPSEGELLQAKKLITTELLGDFPFVGPSERAHAVALLLQPFCRELIDGPTPLFLFEKPMPGTGATLLVDLLTYPASGRELASMTEGRDEDEWRKRITSKLLNSPQFLLLDNLRRRLDSAAVASALTAMVWEDRRLGASQTVRLPVRCCWIATGNNPTVSNEIARRTIRIRLNAKIDRPWLRSGFRHANIRGWAKENRGELVWAALTLIRSWLRAGRPSGAPRLGMFESWSTVLGGIIDHAGIAGFLGNLDEFYEQSDAEGATLRAFVGCWWDRWGEQEVKPADLFAIAKTDAPLPLGDGSEQSQRIRLGKLLSDIRDRIFNLDGQQVQIVRGPQKQRAFGWWLRLVGDLEMPVGECGECSECFPTYPACAGAHAHECDLDGAENTH